METNWAGQAAANRARRDPFHSTLQYPIRLRSTANLSSGIRKKEETKPELRRRSRSHRFPTHQSSNSAPALRRLRKIHRRFLVSCAPSTPSKSPSWKRSPLNTTSSSLEPVRPSQQPLFVANHLKVSPNACSLGMPLRSSMNPLTLLRVFSVKGKKVLHIDRNDHYGG